MSRFIIPIAVAVVYLLIVENADAGAIVTLTPNSPGPYMGGETLLIDVSVTTDQTIQARLLGFDFSQTDPAFGLAPQFTFDFSSLVGSFLYSTFPDLPYPTTVNTSSGGPIPGFILTLVQNIPFHSGSIMITLPDAPGTYVLDVMNFDASSDQYGARISFFLGNEWTTWSTADDGNVEISGGQLCIPCIPEPATLAMLAFGSGILLRRRGGFKRETV